MQAIEWKRKSIGSFLADGVVAALTAWLSPRCPECRALVQEKATEVIADVGDWHVGWRQYACGNCDAVRSRLVVTRQPRNLQYQTHAVC